MARRVAMFKDQGKSACNRLNEWLNNHPDALLVDIKPVVSGAGTATIFVILEIAEKNEKNNEKNNDEKENKEENKEKKQS